MDHDVRYDAHAADPREATQHDLPAVPRAQPVEQRLARLEAAVERLADAVAALMLRLDGRR